MTGYNMPPGVSPRGIPGNDAPDGPPELDELYELLDRRDELLIKLGNPEESITCRAGSSGTSDSARKVQA